jgi:hypothetical protein
MELVESHVDPEDRGSTFSKMLLPVYQATCHQIPEDNIL